MSAFAGLGVAVCLSAGSAAALDGDCLWETLPQARREALLVDLTDGELPPLEFSVDDIAAWEGECGVTPDKLPQAVMALGGKIGEVQTAVTLEKRFGLSGERLDRAWEALPKPQRDAIVRFVSDLAAGRQPSPEDEKRFGEAVVAVARSCGLQEDAALPSVGNHLAARAMRMAIEQGAVQPPGS